MPTGVPNFKFLAQLGCPRSGPVNANRLQCKYKYKLALKDAEAEANKSLNDDLCHIKLIRKDDKGFWKAWCKKFCTGSLHPTTVLDGKYGDVDLLNTLRMSFSLTLPSVISSMVVRCLLC